MRFSSRNLFTWLLALAVATGLFGCGTAVDSEEAGLAASCAAPADQRGSFMARVAGFPLTVKIDSRFTLGQRQAIAEALSVWNAYGMQRLNTPLFEISPSLINSSSITANPNSCEAAFGTKETFAILRETSIEHWIALQQTKDTPAATFRCDRRGTVTQQLIYIFPELVDYTQMKSVVLHEAGHAIGLHHSCQDGGSRTSWASCSGMSDQHPYRQAVMFPWLQVSKRPGNGTGEVKESLRDNDKLRAQCVVDPI